MSDSGPPAKYTIEVRALYTPAEETTEPSETTAKSCLKWVTITFKSERGEVAHTSPSQSLGLSYSVVSSSTRCVVVTDIVALTYRPELIRRSISKICLPLGMTHKDLSIPDDCCWTLHAPSKQSGTASHCGNAPPRIFRRRG